MGREEIWASEGERYPWVHGECLAVRLHNCFPFELAGLVVAHRFLTASMTKYFVVKV